MLQRSEIVFVPVDILKFCSPSTYKARTCSDICRQHSRSNFCLRWFRNRRPMRGTVTPAGIAVFRKISFYCWQGGYSVKSWWIVGSSVENIAIDGNCLFRSFIVVFDSVLRNMRLRINTEEDCKMYNIAEIFVVCSNFRMGGRLQWQRCCYFSRYCSLSENELLILGAWPFGDVMMNCRVVCRKYSYRWELFISKVGCCILISFRIIVRLRINTGEDCKILVRIYGNEMECMVVTSNYWLSLKVTKCLPVFDLYLKAKTLHHRQLKMWLEEICLWCELDNDQCNVLFVVYKQACPKIFYLDKMRILLL
jgi:hypothetical protein